MSIESVCTPRREREDIEPRRKRGKGKRTRGHKSRKKMKEKLVEVLPTHKRVRSRGYKKGGWTGLHPSVAI